MWTHRMMLESVLHAENAFVTLTYSPDFLPMVGNCATLNSKDMQDFLKRLRQRIYPKTVRFYGVGEYGDDSWRPHYHLALFGYPSCRYGFSRYSRERADCCFACDLVRDVWGRGAVFIGSFGVESAQYVCGYVTKKMTKDDDPRLLSVGQQPEFARMSRRPGIGYNALHDIADKLMEYDLEKKLIDVPSALYHGKRLMPLGRYMRAKLRLMVGRDEKTPQVIQDVAQEEVQLVRDLAFENSQSFAEALRFDREQEALNLAGRTAIKKGRRVL